MLCPYLVSLCPPTTPLLTQGDLSGHLLAYLSLSPVFVIVGFVTLIIFKRELHTVSEYIPGCPSTAPPIPPHQGGGIAPFHPGCFPFPALSPPFLKFVVLPGWFRGVYWLGWEVQSDATVFGRGWQPAGTQRPG